jgi:hypothetical protein
MSTAALSILPSDWDIDFFLSLTGVTNHYGYDVEQDGIHFRYLATDYDTVIAAVNAYPVQYLTVMRPSVLTNLSEERKRRIENFTYHGTPVPLDPESRANLTGAALGLTRNVDVDSIHWKIANGVYATLPRNTILDLADQAFRYVEECFTHEKDIATDIMAATDINVLGAIQIDQGWPPYPGETA